MRWIVRLVTVVCVLGLAASALAQFPGGLPGPGHQLAGFAVRHAGRQVVHGNVVHYWFDVAVGRGPFDVIRLHRVVKETAPGRPVRKMEGVLMLPGSPQLFEQIFLPPASAGVEAEEGSIALFLASHGVDVWGMDYGWSFVPYGTADFAPLEGWGIDKDSAHVRSALSIARSLRALSGQGVGPIHLLGFSYGGFLAFSTASEDTQRPGILKNVKGIIPVEGAAFKNTSTVVPCNSAATLAAQLAAGAIVVDSSWMMAAGRAAVENPDALSEQGLAALSPYFPTVPARTFTNYQWALASFIRSLFFAGTYAPAPASVTTLFTDGGRIVELLANTPPYQLVRQNYEMSASRCDSPDHPVAFDDHLGEVAVPIFAVSRRIVPTLDVLPRTASTDVTTLVLNPTQVPSLYGHADVMLANDAAAVVWQPILDWILARR
jgi:pimeloyl-ACP methyl ester carboxylesterase